MNMRQHSGFSLMELMIAVAIVGILASVAYPAYVNYTKQAKRADAKAALVSFANAMERWYTANNTFLGAAAGGTDTGAPDSSVFPSQSPFTGTANYNLTINSATATTYELRATGLDGLASDSCSPLWINEQGGRGPDGCW